LPTRVTTQIILSRRSPKSAQRSSSRRSETAKIRRSYDIDLYKERNIIERFSNKLKQFRRVATRYDKLLANFMGFVKLAAIAIWLK
jgi:transposase